MLKGRIKDRPFRAIEEIITAVHRVWSEVTLDDLQSVFFNWMERIEYVIDHEWEYYTD
jgi:hypothetical protein